MKKSLLALAVLGAFAGAVSAQSSVTLYGRVDGGFSRIDPKAGTTSEANATTGISSGILGGSRWGIRGSEDLGGGLRGIFTLESGFNLDDGTTGQSQTNTRVTPSATNTRLFGRQAYAGVAGGFGTVVLGRLATFSSGTGDFDRFGSLDPLRTGYSGLGWQATFSSASALRVDNAVAYLTPNLAGFSAGVGYTFSPLLPELAGGASANNAGYFTYANYSAGPIYAVVTYDQFKLGESTPSRERQSHLQVGFGYDLKVVRLTAAYGQEKNQFALGTVGATGGSDAKAWALGAVVPIGANRIGASYQNRKRDAEGTITEGKRTVWALTYEYSFSRRTTGYAAYGSVTDKDGFKTATSGGSTQTFLGLSHAF